MTILKAPEAELRPMLWRRTASSVGATLGLLLLPKCPLCVTAYLMSLGVGFEAAQSAAPVIRPLAWLFVVSALSALGIGVWRVARRRAARNDRPTCCCEERASVYRHGNFPA